VIIMIMRNEDLPDVREWDTGAQQLPRHTVACINEIRLAIDNEHIGRLRPIRAAARASLSP
jgi:hypothetical protein